MRTAGYELRTFLIAMAAFGTIMVGILLMVPGSVALPAFASLQPQFDLAPLRAAPGPVQLHVAAVLAALVLGPVQFALPKGTSLHRGAGWLWVGAMFLSAVTSLFIREINAGGFSPIHIFSAFTFVSLPLGVWLARRGDVRGHRGVMTGLYIGLVIAGLLAAAPGRVIWDMFLG